MGIKTHLINGGAVRLCVSFSETIIQKLKKEAEARCEGNISMLLRDILAERYKIKSPAY